MKVFFSIYFLCFMVLMFTLEILSRNGWVLIAAVSGVISLLLTMLYFQQERIEALEKRMEQLEEKE